MSKVLAVAGGESAAVVSGVAAAIADVLRTEVAWLDTRLPGNQRASAVLEELDQTDAVLGVLARDTAALGRSWWVAGRSAKPIVVVPPTLVVSPPPVISRVLVPLDGTLESATAVRATMELFADAGVELIILHVFDEATAPRFWDQAAHARRGWEEEFRARFRAPANARIELRSGIPGDHVVKVATDERIDLITLGWSQRLDAGRARTVRKAVGEAGIPVMLIPLA
jgi:Universal stress protein family